MDLRRAAWLLSSGLLALAEGCGDDSGALAVPPPTESQGAPASGATDVFAECDQAAGGTPCGDPGSGFHCIFNACVKNSCGDGYVGGIEECDDGDQVDGNGCSALCKLEKCGNGRLDSGEECDDGNDDDADRCSHCRRQSLDGGADASAEPPANQNCPTHGQLSVSPMMGAAGDILALSGDSIPGVEYQWGAQPVRETGEVDGPVKAAGNYATSQFQCDGRAAVQTWWLFQRVVSKGTCPPILDVFETPVSCEAAPDAGFDAGVVFGSDLPEAGASSDVGASDAGTGTDAAPADAGGAKPDGATAGGQDAGLSQGCRDCLAEQCSNYSGTDLYGPCFGQAAAGTLDPGPLTQPAFTQACVDAVVCSLTAPSGCGFDVAGPGRCYCGTDVDTCLKNGPVASAECLLPWEHASRCNAGDFQCVLGRFQQLDLPAAYAFFMIQCANDPIACGPKCTTK